jgi:signal transduction histidine kinase
LGDPQIVAAAPDRGDADTYHGDVAEDRLALDRGLARGIGALRWAALIWACVGVAIEREHLEHTGLAVAGLFVAAAITVAATALVSSPGAWAASTWFVAGEVAVGAGLLILDGVVYDAARAQSLPWAWPAAGIVTVAVVAGAGYGLAAAGVAAVASFAGESILRGSAEWTVAAASKSALFALAAIVAAHVSKRLRQAEREISTTRARDELANTLHDGVLQTLAAIQRRTDDPTLGALARDQERELRSFLFGTQRSPESLAAALRAVGDAVARRHGVETQVVLADDLPELAAEPKQALVGAASEALNNAAKHSGANRIVMYAEPGEARGQVFCSVRDDGVGFDAATVAPGEGLRRSVRGRIADVGGTVEIDSRAGGGTEVRMWVG